MKPEDARLVVSFLMVTAVCSAFGAFASWKIRDALKRLRIPSPWTWRRLLTVLDAVFSGVLLVGVVIVYVVVLTNYGR